MINNSLKIIHSKFSRIYKFLFFLRYIFLIFIIAISLFLSIPKFFNYESKLDNIRQLLLNNYNLKLSSHKLIKFRIFPVPHLLIEKSSLKVKDKPIIFNSADLSINLKFKDIYNLEDFNSKKIALNNSKIDLEIDKTPDLFFFFKNSIYNLDIQNLNLNITKNENKILEISDINYLNHGFKKGKIFGKIFDKKFLAQIKNDYLNFKIPQAGIKAEIKFDKLDTINQFKGSSKISILSNYLKFDFTITDNIIKIQKSSLRGKYVSIFFESLVIYEPFFEINSEINLNKINKKLINNVDIVEILRNEKMIKKINSKNKIFYDNKFSIDSLIPRYSIQFDLANGRLVSSGKVFTSGGVIDFKADSLLTEEYPRLNFEFVFWIEDMKKLLKKVLIRKEVSLNKFKLSAKGSLNLLNKKVNLKSINIDNDYTANSEDLKYFKETFENTLLKNDFLNIFKLSEMKKFILEII